MRSKLVLSLFIMTIAVSAEAGGPERVAPVTEPLVMKECGECHMAFQPGLLPAGSWRRIMANLSDHFGDRATLQNEEVVIITNYLTKNAGKGDPNILRITEQGWWRHEHGEGHVSQSAWSQPNIRSRSNCLACHRLAAQGSYDDD